MPADRMNSWRSSSTLSVRSAPCTSASVRRDSDDGTNLISCVVPCPPPLVDDALCSSAIYLNLSSLNDTHDDQDEDNDQQQMNQSAAAHHIATHRCDDAAKEPNKEN